LKRCTSKAVRPAKINTPSTEIVQSSALDARNMLTTIAIRMAKTPIIKNEPIAVSSRRVVAPHAAIAP